VHCDYSVFCVIEAVIFIGLVNGIIGEIPIELSTGDEVGENFTNASTGNRF